MTINSPGTGKQTIFGEVSEIRRDDLNSFAIAHSPASDFIYMLNAYCHSRDWS